MKTVLICHEDAPLNLEGLARWMASFTDLVGIVVLREQPGQYWRRAKRELSRIGGARFFDVLAFRLYSKLFLSRSDAAWERSLLNSLREKYPPLPADLPRLITHTPNSKECEAFLKNLAPDFILARCKFIMKDRIFNIPTRGTWVMHPGICPEYRNAHGCFWALAHRDLEKVGMSLLKIDAGIDTGPIAGYYMCAYDEVRESPAVISHRVVFDNLDALQLKFAEIARGDFLPIDIRGRPSGLWGQPWMSAYIRWKLAARRLARANHHPSLSRRG